MADDAAELLAGSGKEAGHILEGHQRNVERVAEAHEASALHRRIDIEAAGQVRRLIGHDADGAAIHAREPDHDVLREMLVHFEKIAVIHYAMNDVLDVVWQGGVGGHQGIELGVHAVDGVFGSAARRIVAIVLGQVTEQLANHAQAVGIILGDEVADAADAVMRHGTAQPFLGDVFMGDGLDDVGTGDEHVAGAVDHEDEIGDGGRVDGAAGAGSHDGGNLRHDAAGQRVAQEDIGVTGQGSDAFLNTGAAGIVQAHQRGSVLQREIHHFANFLRVGFR